MPDIPPDCARAQKLPAVYAVEAIGVFVPIIHDGTSTGPPEFCGCLLCGSLIAVRVVHMPAGCLRPH